MFELNRTDRYKNHPKTTKIRLIYNTKYNYEKFNSLLKSIDEEYRTTIINFGKYKLVMFAMAKLMEMETTEQNRVVLYLFNNITVYEEI